MPAEFSERAGAKFLGAKTDLGWAGMLIERPPPETPNGPATGSARPAALAAASGYARLKSVRTPTRLPAARLKSSAGAEWSPSRADDRPGAARGCRSPGARAGASGEDGAERDAGVHGRHQVAGGHQPPPRSFLEIAGARRRAIGASRMAVGAPDRG